MIDHLPDRLDLIATAEAGRDLRGRLAVAGLERLLPALASDQGELEIELNLGKDAGGTRFLAGTIQGEVILDCQRCMKDMTLPLDLVFRLGLIRDERAVHALPDCYEPLAVQQSQHTLRTSLRKKYYWHCPLYPCTGILMSVMHL